MLTLLDSSDSSPSDLLDAKGRILHQKIRCNGCGSEPLAGNRFKCLNCPDFVPFVFNKFIFILCRISANAVTKTFLPCIQQITSF